MEALKTFFTHVQLRPIPSSSQSREISHPLPWSGAHNRSWKRTKVQLWRHPLLDRQRPSIRHRDTEAHVGRLGRIPRYHLTREGRQD